MKRHPGLAELSREHHLELSQARRLRRAVAVEPEARLAVAAAFVEEFFGGTVDHFRREEEQVFPLYARHAGPTALLDRVLREHMQLQGLARELRAEVVAGDARPETVAALGTLLDQHVRLEERELFEEIQRLATPAELEALG